LPHTVACLGPLFNENVPELSEPLEGSLAAERKSLEIQATLGVSEGFSGNSRNPLNLGEFDNYWKLSIVL
jgi:hypothetical protein